MHLGQLLLLLGALPFSLTHPPPANPLSKPIVTELFRYPPSNPIFLENLLRLPDGRLLLSSFTSSFLIFNPHRPNPVPSTLFTFPNATAYTGITSLGQNRYAVSAGLMTGLGFADNTAKIHIFSLPPNSLTVQLEKTIPIPNTNLPNGLLSLPTDRNTLLSADSLLGRILRINLTTGNVTTVLENLLLAPSATLPLGINGLASRPGDDEHLYFTSSSQGFFGRIKITKQGYIPKKAKIEVLAKIMDEPVGLSNTFDDLDFDSSGRSVYIAWQRSRVLKVTDQGRGKGWRQEMVVDSGEGGDTGSVKLRGVTAVKVGKGDRELFVTTAGLLPGDESNTRVGGQVVRVDI